jgi:hypothetical protein
MKRVLGTLLLTLLIVGVSATNAFADPPTRVDVSAPVDLTLTSFCSFPVHVTSLKNKEVLTIFSSGRQQTTGQLKVQLTNLATGKSINANISGPATLTPNPDGSFAAVFRGRSLIFPNETALSVETSPIFISSGQTTMNVTSDLSSFKLLSVPTGSTVDVCAALA